MTETSTYTHAELSERLAEVERERDALRLMEYERDQAIRDAVAKARKDWAREDQQAIRDIRAEAGRAGYLKGFRDYCSRLWPSEQEFIDGPLAQYAQQLRNGERE